MNQSLPMNHSCNSIIAISGTRLIYSDVPLPYHSTISETTSRQNRDCRISHDARRVPVQNRSVPEDVQFRLQLRDHRLAS